MKYIQNITKSQLNLLERNGFLYKEKCSSVITKDNGRYDVGFSSSIAYFEAYDLLYNEKRINAIKKLGELEKEDTTIYDNKDKQLEIDEYKKNLLSEFENLKNEEIKNHNHAVAIGIQKAIDYVKNSLNS